MDAQNISVAVRARPLFHQEESSTSPWCITNNSLLLRASNSIYKDNVFRYATVFGPGDDNATVFAQTAAPLVNTVLSGINCTLLAYGQTGSGKTHTILGSPDDPGVVPRAWAELFHEISCNKARVFTVHATFLELYNEELRDLMDPQGDKLQVQQVRDGTCIIPGLRRFEVRSYEQIQDLLQQASNNRVLSATKMNQMSSRSHALFSLIIESQALSQNDPHPHLYSTLVVVDLAGSERTAKSGTETGIRRREREAINLSLLSLGMVINQLTEGGAAVRHVNYRNSLLTRLLQVSLGGNARTSMICTITPSTSQLDESISTLRFASNATKVKNRLRVNVESSDAVKIAHLKQEVEQLKKQGIELQRRLSGTESEWGSRGADPSWEAERSALVTDLEACRSLVRELQMENVNLQRQIKDKKKMEEDLLATQQMVKELKKQNAVLTANLAFEKEMQQQLQLLLTRSQASLEDPPQYSELMQEVSHPSPSPAPHSMPSVHSKTPAPADSHHDLPDPHQRMSDLAPAQHAQQLPHQQPLPSSSSSDPPHRSSSHSSHSRHSSGHSFSSPALSPLRLGHQSSGGHESGIPSGPRPQRSASSSYTPRTPHTPDLTSLHEDYIAAVSEPSPDLTIRTRLHQVPALKASLNGVNFSSPTPAIAGQTSSQNSMVFGQTSGQSSMVFGQTSGQSSMIFGQTPSQSTMIFGQSSSPPVHPPGLQGLDAPSSFPEPTPGRSSHSGAASRTNHLSEASSHAMQRDVTDDNVLQRKSSGLSASSSLSRSRSADPSRSRLLESNITKSSSRQDHEASKPSSRSTSRRQDQDTSKPDSLTAPRLGAANRTSDSGSIPLAQSFYSARANASELATDAGNTPRRDLLESPEHPSHEEASSRPAPPSQILPSTPSVSEYSYRPSSASSPYRSSSDGTSSRPQDPVRDAHSLSVQPLSRSRNTSSASLDFSSSVEFTSNPAEAHNIPTSRRPTRTIDAAVRDSSGSFPSGSLFASSGKSTVSASHSSSIFNAPGHSALELQSKGRVRNSHQEAAPVPEPWFGQEQTSKLVPSSSHDFELPSSSRLDLHAPQSHDRHVFEEEEQGGTATSLSQFRSMLEQNTQPAEFNARHTSIRQTLPPPMSLAERVESLSGVDHSSVITMQQNNTSSLGVSAFQEPSVAGNRGVAVRGSYPVTSIANPVQSRTRINGVSSSMPITRRSLSAIAASTQAATVQSSSMPRSVSDTPPSHPSITSQTIRANQSARSNPTASRAFGVSLFGSSMKSSASSAQSVKHSSHGSASAGQASVDAYNVDASSGTASLPPAVRVRLHDVNGHGASGGDAGASKGGQDGGVLRKAREAAIAQRNRDAVSRLALLRAKTEAVRKQLPAFRFG